MEDYPQHFDAIAVLHVMPDHDSFTADIRFAVLGPLEVAGTDGRLSVGGPKERRLVAMLVARAGEVVSVDALAEGMWDGNPPHSAVKTLQAYVARVRRALEPWQGLVTEPPGYRLAVDRQQVDALRFTDLAAAARRCLEAEDNAEAERLAVEALGLRRGTPYLEFQDSDFSLAEASRLDEVGLDLLEVRGEAALELGKHAELVVEFEAQCRRNPLRERFWAQLIVALYRCGRQAEALAAYRRARGVLVVEIGVEPGPDLRRLEQRILDHDPTLQLPADRQPDLPPALDARARVLIGRAAELTVLRQRWERATQGDGGVLVIAGPPGSGRTRLVAEFAGEIHAAGAAVQYLGPGEAVGTTQARGSGLLVLDDLDRTNKPTDIALPRLAAEAAACRTLVIVVYDPGSATTALRAELLRTPHDELLLEPLEQRAITEIARMYAADMEPEQVERVAVASGGWPARIHVAASELAMSNAAERVQLAAGRAHRARRDLAAVRADVRAGVGDLTKARQAIAAQQPGRDGHAICPYKGLAPYLESDAELFFGREALVTSLCARMVDTPFVAVVGPTGSGKSSLVRAGVLPALAGGVVPGLAEQPHVVITPGEQPLATLQSAITADRPSIVVVDQFEESFTACTDTTERHAFFNALLGLAGQAGGRVIVTLRGDFVDACVEHPELSHRLGEATVLVGPMTADEIHRAVELPARHVGLDVEPELVDTIVTDVANQPGALPLLSTALLETWKQRRGRLMTEAGYLKAGRLSGAISRLAETAYGRLDEDGRQAARRLLLRLADVGESGAPVRRRVPRDELPTGRATEAALAALVDRRLLTASDTGIEVTHEALLTAWPRLAQWLADDVQGRALRAHLTPSARSWIDGGRPDADLYRGPRLAAAMDWAADHRADLTTTEQEFLDASEQFAQRELAEQRARADREARGRRRLRLVLIGLVALLLIAAAATGIAVQQRAAALDAERVAEARRLGARALSETDLDRSLLLAALAVRTDSSFETEGDLLTALQRSPAALRQVRGPKARPQDLTLSPDGKVLAAVYNEGWLMLWDAATLEPLAEPIKLGQWAGIAEFAADSRSLAVVTAAEGGGEALALFDVAEQREVWRIPPLKPGPNFWGRPAFSPDGKTIAAAFGDILVVSDIESGREVRRTPGVAGHPNEMVFTLIVGNDYLMLTGRARQAVLVDRTTGKIRKRFAMPVEMFGVDLSPDRHSLAVGGTDGQIALINPRTGGITRRFGDERTEVSNVAFSPDGRLLATLTLDRKVSVWDVRSGKRVHELEGHSGWPRGLAFSKDNRTLYTAGLDTTLIAWDLSGDRRFGTRLPRSGRPPVTHDGPFDEFAGWSADRRRAAIGHGDGFLSSFNPTVGTVIAETPGVVEGLTDFALAPDGRFAYAPAENGEVARWDTSTGRVPVKGKIVTGAIAGDVGVSPDGSRIVVTSTDLQPRPGAAFIVEASTLRVLRRIDLPHQANSPTFSHDGRLIALPPNEEGPVHIIEVATGRTIATTPRVKPTSSAAFSPDGSALAISGFDGAVQTFDISGRRLAGPTAAHAGFVRGTSFSSSGRRLLTSGTDGTARLWEAATLRPIGKPLAVQENGWIWAVFSPDDRQILALENNGRVTTYDATVDAWLAHACSIVRRDFTAEERRIFAIDPAAPRSCP